MRRERELDSTVRRPAEAEKFRCEKLAEATRNRMIMEAEVHIICNFDNLKLQIFRLFQFLSQIAKYSFLPIFSFSLDLSLDYRALL